MYVYEHVHMFFFYTFKKERNTVHYKLAILASIYQRHPCVTVSLDYQNNIKLNSNGKKTFLFSLTYSQMNAITIHKHASVLEHVQASIFSIIIVKNM